MTSLLQWNLLKTLQNVENRLCVDCSVPLTKSDTYGSNYGTWLCSTCTVIHKKLMQGEKYYYKHALNDHWSDEEVNYLLSSTKISTTGNLGFNEIHEKYIPEGWKKLTPTCSQREREFWIRAKYCFKLFLIPCKVNSEVTSAKSHGVKKKKKKVRDGPTVLPSRIVDYFLVISASNDITNVMGDNTKTTLENISNLEIKPAIQTCFPSQDTHADMQIPDMLGSFVFPYGFKLSHLEKQPMFFTFVLTDVNGVKLYGAALHVHELIEPQELMADVRMPAAPTANSTPVLARTNSSNVTPVIGRTNSGNAAALTRMSSDAKHELVTPKSPDADTSPGLGPASAVSLEEMPLRTRRPSGIKRGQLLQEYQPTKEELWPVLYAPKALVLLSHYPFFNLFKEYLEVIYRISLSLNYIPLERYIINFVAETPLPPQGLTEINYTLIPDKTLQITRPRKNQLPMVDFSYRLLFMFLSIDNILTVFEALCCEFPVCIISENVAMLTPVCETLLSLLFPFTWQGAYIPVLPDHMTEILDAPVPYLIGLRRDYFDENQMENPCHRPAMSVFVDLDNDKIHLGRADDKYGSMEVDLTNVIHIEKPNVKVLSKLKAKLVEFGGCLYHFNSYGTNYKEILATYGVAFPHNEHLVPIESLGDMSGGGTGISVVHKDSHMNLIKGTATLTKRNVSVFSGFLGTKPVSTPPINAPAADLPAVNITSATSNVNTSGSQEYCTRVISSSNKNLPITDPVLNTPGHSALHVDNFNAQEIRFAFLRFFVTVFIDYQDFFQFQETVELIPEHLDGNHSNNHNHAVSADAAHTANADGSIVLARKTSSMKLFGTVEKGMTLKDGTTPMCTTDKSKPPRFELEKFLLHCNNDPFLTNISQTQIFSKFIQEKTSALFQEANDHGTPSTVNSPHASVQISSEVRYFDESILSKNNRSRIKFVKSNTPFLSDMRDAIAETYSTPLPNNYGIPARTTPYLYNKFPLKLNANYCTPVRVPRTLVKEPETSRVNDQGSQTATMISNALLRRRQSLGGSNDEAILDLQDSKPETEDSNRNFGGEVVIEAYLTDALMKYNQVITQIVLMQAKFRMRKQRKLFVVRFAELKRLLNMVTFRKRIHRFVQMALCRIYFRKCRRAIVRIQLKWRGYRQYKIYHKCKRNMILVQALYRRYASYKRQSRQNLQLLSDIRNFLPLLWHVTFTPLIERSRYWHYFDVLLALPWANSKRVVVYKYKCGFLELSLYATEFTRLFSTSNWPNNRVKHVNIRILLTQIAYLKSNTATASGASIATLSTKAAIETERNELYNIMKQYMDKDASVKDSLFHQFGLVVTKKRKLALCQAVWNYNTDNKLNNPSSLITLSIQSTLDDNRYVANKGHVINKSATTERLLQRINQNNAGITVSTLDQLWIENRYSYGIHQACVAYAQASQVVMSRMKTEHGQLLTNHRNLEMKWNRWMVVNNMVPLIIQTNTGGNSNSYAGTINTMNNTLNASFFKSNVSQKHNHSRSMTYSNNPNSPLLHRKLIRKPSKYNVM